MQKLERALARAQIAVRSAEIGIDHADQCQLREVMAFGHDLGADQHVGLAFGHRADRGLRLLWPMHRIGGGYGETRGGKRDGEFLCHTFYARAAGDETRGGMARGAFLR